MTVSSSPRLRALLFSTAITAAITGAALPARAQSVIEQPRQHVGYLVELEPHVDLGFWRYNGGHGHGAVGPGNFGDPEFGAGFRATIVIADPAFVRRINDNVGITFGVDLTGCPSSYCGNQTIRFWAPVGVQWNFFLTRKVSVFPEAGFVLHADRGGVVPDFFAAAGLRYHFADRTALTFRVGYPFVSVGLSFFRG
jgi:hypothetical protein